MIKSSLMTLADGTISQLIESCCQCGGENREKLKRTTTGYREVVWDTAFIQQLLFGNFVMVNLPCMFPFGESKVYSSLSYAYSIHYSEIYRMGSTERIQQNQYFLQITFQFMLSNRLLFRSGISRRKTQLLFLKFSSHPTGMSSFLLQQQPATGGIPVWSTANGDRCC